jgi:hypothetical protein
MEEGCLRLAVHPTAADVVGGAIGEVVEIG